MYIKGGLTPTAHVRISMNCIQTFTNFGQSHYTHFVCILFTILNIYVHIATCSVTKHFVTPD